AAIAFHGRFRVYTIATLVFTTALALTSIWYVTEFIANRPTPWMGIVERTGQYVMNLWYAVLAVMLLRRRPGGPGVTTTGPGDATSRASSGDVASFGLV